MRELIEARCCFDAGEWRQAEERYRRIVEADPQSEEALHRLGLLALHANDPTSAADWLQKAAPRGSCDASLFNVLDVARAKLKQFEEYYRIHAVGGKAWRQRSAGHAGFKTVLTRRNAGGRYRSPARQKVAAHVLMFRLVARSS
jgi:predicted Zn-dependent protease